MAAGDTVTRPPGNDGVPMIEGHPNEPQGPEDAAGPGVKRGDYELRGDGKQHHEYTRDVEGNLVIHDQTAAMEAAPGLGQDGEKGGVNTEIGSEAPGSVADNEKQLITIDADDGTFVLSFDGDDTNALDYNEGALAASAIDSALEGLDTIPTGGVAVTGDNGGPYTVEFTGGLGGINVPLIEIDPENLTGGNATGEVTQINQGG